MPNSDGNIQFTISDILEKVAELDKEITIVMIAVDMHNEKIDQLADALYDSPGNISKLKFAKPFNMWCMQNPNTYNEIDNYFDVLMNYLKALRDYGYTANDATNLADRIKNLTEIIKKRYFDFRETLRLLDSQQDIEFLPSQPNNLDQLINKLGGILVDVEEIIGDLYDCGRRIDEAMKQFLVFSARDDTYIMKLLQKINQHPDLKAWCRPWAINWDDPEEESEPLKSALAALPPLRVEVLSYEQGNRRSTFTIS